MKKKKKSHNISMWNAFKSAWLLFDFSDIALEKLQNELHPCNISHDINLVFIIWVTSISYGTAKAVWFTLLETHLISSYLVVWLRLASSWTQTYFFLFNDKRSTLKPFRPKIWKNINRRSQKILLKMSGCLQSLTVKECNLETRDPELNMLQIPKKRKPGAIIDLKKKKIAFKSVLIAV